jgi:hypothetical protein
MTPRRSTTSNLGFGLAAVRLRDTKTLPSGAQIGCLVPCGDTSSGQISAESGMISKRALFRDL